MSWAVAWARRAASGTGGSPKDLMKFAQSEWEGAGLGLSPSSSFPTLSPGLTAVNIRGCQLPRGTKVNADELALWAEKQPQSGARAVLLHPPRAPQTLCLPASPPSCPNPTWSPTAATHKAGRVVIAQGLGIAESLHGRVSLDDLILEGALVAG